ncbi:hypothetical protein EAH76_14625 [Sphingomonas glacialis]|uniref:Uncharacterized protein n=1 Tax=Sphingomonas glacialis TaxID=658225 RepID=A0A502FS38_9SPHN|nr:hypothetical protein EAH76_14625 [Sphingomonas glacialis]
MTLLLHHAVDCGCKFVRITIDQYTNASVYRIAFDSGSAHTGNQRLQMPLVTLHASKQLRRYFERLRRRGCRMKLIDTHDSSLTQPV